MTNHVNAQQKNNNNTTTTNLNFTKIVKGKDFKFCVQLNLCNNPVKVLYQGKTMLVLTSDADVIWKVVEIARENGYKIDGISNYFTSNPDTGGTVKTLVAMSKDRSIDR